VGAASTGLIGTLRACEVIDDAEEVPEEEVVGVVGVVVVAPGVVVEVVEALGVVVVVLGVFVNRAGGVYGAVIACDEPLVVVVVVRVQHALLSAGGSEISEPVVDSGGWRFRRGFSSSSSSSFTGGRRRGIRGRGALGTAAYSSFFLQTQ
jgi:hypothetical protein